MSTTRKSLWTLAAILTSACASGPRWVPAGGAYTPPSSRYTLQLPQGWKRLDAQDWLLTSREGPFLQSLALRVIEVGKPLGSNTKKVLARGMLPQEAAEVVHDAIASSPGMQGMKLLENAPAELDGRPGFKLVVGYKDEDGLKMKAVVYGVLVGDSLYQLTYRAPERYYFERDLITVEQVRATFKIAQPAAAQARGAN
jgi:hypothetical protein